MPRPSSALVLLAVFVVSSVDAQPTPSAFDKTVPLVPVERFRGTLSLKGPDGRPRELQVQVRNWFIQNRQKIDRFPQDGTIVVQLRAGDLVTIINGQRQPRKPDDFWTVPAGTTMGIETAQDTVALQTVATQE